MDNQPLGYATQTFNVDLAKKLKSADLAILVQFFINCIRIHKDLKRNFREGRTWNFCTRAELAATFPWLSADQCRRFMDKLVKNKILRKGNFNKLKGDNTVWYAFENEELWNFSKTTNTPTTVLEGRADLPEVGQIQPSNTTVLPTSIQKDNVSRDGGNVDKPKPKKTLPSPKKTMPSSAKVAKTMDASRRWKLTQDQSDSFNFLDSCDIDTDEGTKAYWSKKYSLDRIIEVYEESKAASPKSMAAYMQKLLKSNANVAKSHASSNLEYAKYFKDKTGWQQLEIMKKYVKIPCGSGTMELDFNMQPVDFQRTLMNKHANRT